MSKKNVDCEIDSKEIDKLLENLNQHKRAELLFNALKKGGRKLAALTKESMIRKLGAAATTVGRFKKKMTDAVGMRADESLITVKVAILQYFLARFFELGTDPRTLRKEHAPKPDGKLRRTLKKGEYRGQIEGKHFFKDARESDEPTNVMLNYLKQEIEKLND